MFRKISYGNKLYISFTIAIFIILTASGAFFYQYNFELLKKSMEQNTVESLRLINARIEDRLMNLDIILKKLHTSQELKEQISVIQEGTENFFVQNPSKRTKLNNILLSTMISEAMGTSMHYVSKYGDSTSTFMKIYPYVKNKLTKEEIEDLPYVQDGLKTKEYRMFLPPHDNPWLKGEQIIFSVVRPMRDNFTTYGILEISQEINELEKLCTIEEDNLKYKIRIIDEQGITIYDTGTSDCDKVKKEYDLDAKQGLWYKNKEALYAFIRSDVTGWTIIMERNLLELRQQTDSLRKMIIMSYLFGFFVILLFTRIVIKGLTKPLAQLRDNLSELLLDGEIHITTQSSSNEITVLTIAIEKILNKIKQQNDTIIQTRKRALKAHVDMLEAQMNPHFLYNTLSVIGACGYEDGSVRVNTMCNELADLLRYSIRYEHKLVKFADEINNIKNYLSIMEKRYEDMINIRWQLDSSMDLICVPKLILQPIVENCFKHGFQNQEPIWKIEIISFQENGKWRLIIKNSGVPFNKLMIEKICNNFENYRMNYSNFEVVDNENMIGVGLENIWKRLYMQYLDSTFFEIRIEEEWSVVEIGGEILENEGKITNCDS